MFDHERLEASGKVSDKFVGQTNAIISALQKGNNKLVDQLYRAAIFVPLNIVEGADLYSKKEKQRSYRIARGSAMECAAAIDICLELNIAKSEPCNKAKETLHRVVSMLTKLIQRRGDPL